MKCVILQPSYIPWRGYFHLIQKADVFVFYDDVQYDKRGWRNRNRIKSATGPIWLTIPVVAKGVQAQGTPIKDVHFVPKSNWKEKHERTLRLCYAKAPYFSSYAPMLASLYAQRTESLADFTIESTVALARELGIGHTRFLRSASLPATGRKTDRLISILQHLGATHYISGPSAQDYLEEEKFAANGITLEYIKYSYPEYPQLHGAFDPQVSILDLLLMAGPDAPKYIWQQP
jgi:hypothetical protein